MGPQVACGCQLWEREVLQLPLLPVPHLEPHRRGGTIRLLRVSWNRPKAVRGSLPTLGWALAADVGVPRFSSSAAGFQSPVLGGLMMSTE